MLVHAVIVAGDRPRPDIGLGADRGVADIGEMGDLGAAADARLLQLDEVADLRPDPDVREGPEVAEGAELRLRLDDGLGKNAVRLEGDAVADTAGAHVAARSDHAVGPDGGRAFQDDAGIDHRVGPDPYGVVDVGRRRIQDGHALAHEALEGAAPEDRGDLRELAPVIDAQAFPRIRCLHRFDGGAAPGQDADHVGQVVFALLVLGHDLAEGRPQGLGVEAVDARADLVDVPLRRRGVPVLDDTDGATALADHPTIARGIRQLGREERGRRARLSVVLDKRLDHVLRHEGLIARQDEDRALAAGAMGLEHRVSGAEALLLLDVGEILRVSHRGPDLGSAVPDDEDHASAEGATQPHRIVDERATGHAVERLGQLGAHALRVAGREDDCSERLHVRHLG